ncbi:hypothetical protein, partial [Asanoa iriomotensis]|uniref:hypothetical protein n=1 Tax=Asanoa iriomotensis TaxID=234613 RepID=UPI001941E61C
MVLLVELSALLPALLAPTTSACGNAHVTLAAHGDRDQQTTDDATTDHPWFQLCVSFWEATRRVHIDHMDGAAGWVLDFDDLVRWRSGQSQHEMHVAPRGVACLVGATGRPRADAAVRSQQFVFDDLARCRSG